MKFNYLVMFCMIYAACVQANVIVNGAFHGANESGVPNGWYNDSHESCIGEFGLAKMDGRDAVRIERRNPQQVYFFRISQNIGVAQPDTLYNFSAWVNGSGNPLVIIYEFLPDGKYTDIKLVCNPQQTGWQQLRQSFKTKPNTVSFKISLIAGSNQGPVYFSDVRLDNMTAAPREIVNPLPKAPEMAADWDDAAWHFANSGGKFTVLGSEYSFPQADTNVKFGLYDNTLQVIYRCDEPHLADIVTGEKSWNNDTVEFFLFDPETHDVYHYGVTPAGEGMGQVEHPVTVGYYANWYSWETTATKGKVVALPTWRFKASKQASAWTAQLAIELPESFMHGKRQFQVLFGRARKLKNFTENSSWGHTGGQFFKECRCQVTLNLPVDMADSQLKRKPLAVSEKTYGWIVPAPQMETKQLHSPAQKDGIPLAPLKSAYASPVCVQVGQGAEKAFKVFEHVFKTRFGVEIKKVTDASMADVVLLQISQFGDLQFQGLKDWQREEAYKLSSTSKAMLTATTHRGLVYAIQSLAQLSWFEGGNLVRQQTEILDWPDMQYRGWHCTAPETHDRVPDALSVIDTMSALKMNWISIQFDNRFKYERHPDLSPDNASTKDDHKKIAELIDLYGMDVIPMTQCLSHFSYFLTKPQYRKFAEVQNPAENAQHKFWNYCPRHPEIHKLVFDMIEEHLECYPKAKWYHVGMDETTFEPFGVCERCKSSTPGELYAEEINTLHDFLKAKGLRMCMWGDQLLVEHNGGNKYKTAEALPKVPRDVIMFDWHYGEGVKYPSVEFFKNLGFDVMPSGWYLPLNITNFIAESYRQNVMGYGGTTWYSIRAIRHSSYLMTAFVLGGEYSWKKQQPTLEQLPYNPVAVYCRLYDGEVTPKAYECSPLNIAPWCNASLSSVTPEPWKALGTGLKWLEKLPFNIPDGEENAIVLGNSSDNSSVLQIPVGGKCKGLVFLQTTTRPQTPVRNLYDKQRLKPRTVGNYLIHYEDGTSVSVPLVWEDNIMDWNTQMDAPHAPVAWREFDKNGAMMSLLSFTWWNPKPEKAITAVDFLSANAKVQPVLAAITAIVK